MMKENDCVWRIDKNRLWFLDRKNRRDMEVFLFGWFGKRKKK